MKNKKVFIFLVIILAIGLIIGGIFFFSGSSSEKEEKLDEKEAVIATNGSILDGKYDNADFVCKKEIREVKVYKMYDVIYVFAKGKNVKKTNLINLIVCNNKKTFDEQMKNDDKVFERYYHKATLSISYEYADEQIFITDDGFTHVDKTLNGYKEELEKDGYVCE